MPTFEINEETERRFREFQAMQSQAQADADKGWITVGNEAKVDEEIDQDTQSSFTDRLDHVAASFSTDKLVGDAGPLELSAAFLAGVNQLAVQENSFTEFILSEVMSQFGKILLKLHKVCDLKQTVDSELFGFIDMDPHNFVEANGADIHLSEGYKALKTYAGAFQNRIFHLVGIMYGTKSLRVIKESKKFEARLTQWHMLSPAQKKRTARPQRPQKYYPFRGYKGLLNATLMEFAVAVLELAEVSNWFGKNVGDAFRNAPKIHKKVATPPNVEVAQEVVPSVPRATKALEVALPVPPVAEAKDSTEPGAEDIAE